MLSLYGFEGDGVGFALKFASVFHIYEESRGKNYPHGYGKFALLWRGDGQGVRAKRLQINGLSICVFANDNVEKLCKRLWIKNKRIGKLVDNHVGSMKEVSYFVVF